VAEAWLIAQEPYVSSRDLGHTVDEVEKLIKRHEAFEKSTATWEERFSALERLTTVCTNNTMEKSNLKSYTTTLTRNIRFMRLRMVMCDITDFN